MTPEQGFQLVLAYLVLGFTIGMGFMFLCESRDVELGTTQKALGVWVIGGLFWPLTLLFLIFEGLVWLAKGFSDGTRHL